MSSSPKKTKSSKDNENNILKCVVVGDGYVGKTCLLSTFVNGTFPTSEYTPTVFENHSVNFTSNGQDYSFIIFDTAGQEDYDSLRSLAYHNAHVFIVCFSIDSNESFKNVSELWVQELRQNNETKNVPIILVCTKTDLKDDKSTATVPDHRAQKLAKDIKAEKYLQCSALKQVGVNEVFDEAFRSALKLSTSKTTGSVCCIL